MKIFHQTKVLSISNISVKTFGMDFSMSFYLPFLHFLFEKYNFILFIDAINMKKGKAAFIFLDQEKAFDRMSHQFIFKTLRTFVFAKILSGG